MNILRLTRLIFGFGVLWLSTVIALRPANSAEHTNVVIIYADDLGWGDLGCYGHPRFKTPNLDRFAAEGVRLTSFYSTYPYCAPSRASLLTGRYPVRYGLTDNPFPKTDLGGIKNAHERGLPPSEITLAELFRAAGYRTGCFGKWHLGHLPRFHPYRQGFDEYFGILYSNDMHPVELYDGEKMIEYPVYQATLTQRLTDRAIDFFRRHREHPFFLYLPYIAPHKPLAASVAYYRKSGAGLYGDVIAELDACIGRLLDALRQLKLEDNTLVFFSSDNGPWYGGSTGGMRGMKAHTWEGGLRVPLIARWPGRIPPGRTSDEPATIMDLFTTSLAAAGIPLPHDRVIDGKNILPLLTAGAKSPHRALFFFRGGRLLAVRRGSWKLHLAKPEPGYFRMYKPSEKWVDPRGPDGVRILAPYEQPHPSQFPGLLTGDPVTRLGLFDLGTDRAEQHDVAGQHPEIVKQLQALARRFEKQLTQERSRIP